MRLLTHFNQVALHILIFGCDVSVHSVCAIIASIITFSQQYHPLTPTVLFWDFLLPSQCEAKLVSGHAVCFGELEMFLG